MPSSARSTVPRIAARLVATVIRPHASRPAADTTYQTRKRPTPRLRIWATDAELGKVDRPQNRGKTGGHGYQAPCFTSCCGHDVPDKEKAHTQTENLGHRCRARQGRPSPESRQDWWPRLSGPMLHVLLRTRRTRQGKGPHPD